MEPSVPSHMEQQHAAFSPHHHHAGSAALSTSKQLEHRHHLHHHHLPGGPMAAFPNSSSSYIHQQQQLQQLQQQEQQPFGTSGRDLLFPGNKDGDGGGGGYGQDSTFARVSSFSSDNVVNYSEDAFTRDNRVESPLPHKPDEDAEDEVDALQATRAGEDSFLSPSVRKLDNVLEAGRGAAFPREDSIAAERSSKRAKHGGGWWREEEGVVIEGPSLEDSDAVKEMETVTAGAGEERNDAGVGSSSAASFRSIVEGAAVAGLGDGCGGEEDAVVNVRGGSVDGAVDMGGDMIMDAGRGVDGELLVEDPEGEGSREFRAGDKDGIGKKKRAELWQDAEMDALVAAYRQIHFKLAVAGKKGKHVFKSANEKWREVRNLLLPLGVDRQPKEIERKWSNLSTAFKQIADWNKKVGRASYWELDEVSKKEKTKAKELPATFRVQLYESMAEFLGDRTAARRSRGWSQYDGPDRALALVGGSGNGVSVGGESTAVAGVLDIPLPMDKLASYQAALGVLDQKRPRVVLVATGSFNPPTYMHVRMFELARDTLIGEGYDVLGGYVSPVNDSYSKKGLAPADHRIALCHLATSDSAFIMVDPWEAKQATYQRSLTVLNRVEHAINTHGFANDEKVRVMLLCGADLLESLTIPGVWLPDQVQTLCHDYGIICIPRDGKDVRKIIFDNDTLYEYRKRIIVVDNHLTNNISSTKLRQNLGRGLSVKYLTPDSVIHYIKTHHLYDPSQL